MPHSTTTHPLTFRALQATKPGFLSLPLPSTPTEFCFLSLPLLPHWFSTKCSHGSPFCFQGPYFQQVHTRALQKNHSQSTTVCQHTPAPSFPHPQLPPFCRSQLTHDPPPPFFLRANFMAIIE